VSECEWGNPNVPEELEAIRAYDPMINIKGQNYLPLHIESGLNDTRVAYWEQNFVQRVRTASQALL
jgi:oligopeptidase B